MSTRAEVESMCAEAVGMTGLDDFGDSWFLGPLSAWAEDLQQPSLHDEGRRFLRRQAVKDLARRLEVLEVLRRHPEIREVTIPPIVYVTGLARSGTTLLHNLLALHPGARALRRWELVAPVPPPEASTHRSDPRIAAVQAQVERLRGTLLERMHWVDADDPEECVWGFLDANAMLGQSASFWMPSWRAAISEQDQTPTFERHRQLIQLLLWKHPVPPGGFLVLKAPQIGARLREFAAVFPEARFVVPHRDPYRSTVSVAVLCRSLGASFLREDALALDGRGPRLALDRTALVLRELGRFADAAPGRLVDVAYPALVEDPAGVVRAVLDADLDDAVDGFLARQRSGRRAAPPEDLDPMGYDQDEVWSDPTIAAYAERFGVQPERRRLTGAPPRTPG